MATTTHITDRTIDPVAEPGPPAPGPVEAPGAADDRALSRAERSALTARLLDEAYSCRSKARRRELLEEVIVVNRGVAAAIAGRYRSRGISQDDLEQAAYEGLTKAVMRFDPALRNDLLTFAVPTIRGEVQRYFRDQGWTVRPPRRVQELQWRLNQVVEELGQRLGREPSEAELRRELDISEAEYAEAVSAFGCFSPTSLDQPTLSDSPTTLGELLPGDDTEADASEARMALAPVVRHLSERDRRILYLRFFEDCTQEAIGRELGVTQMQVSRLLARILTRLRHDLAPSGDTPADVHGDDVDG